MKKLSLFILSCIFLFYASISSASPLPPQLCYSTTGLSLSISWTSVSDADGYTLYYAPAPYTGPDSISSFDMGAETNRSFYLWEDANYYIAVTAHNPQGESSYSNIEQFSMTSSSTSGSLTTCQSGLSNSFYGLYRIASINGSNNNAFDCPEVGAEFYVTDNELLKDSDEYIWVPKNITSITYSGRDSDNDPYSTTMAISTNYVDISEVGTWSEDSSKGWTSGIEIDFQNMSLHLVLTDSSPNYCIGVMDATLVKLQ